MPRASVNECNNTGTKNSPSLHTTVRNISNITFIPSSSSHFQPSISEALMPQTFFNNVQTVTWQRVSWKCPEEHNQNFKARASEKKRIVWAILFLRGVRAIATHDVRQGKHPGCLARGLQWFQEWLSNSARHRDLGERTCVVADDA